MSSRAGHHADVVFVIEDNGFNSSPNDTDFKEFGGNATLDTYDADHQSQRIINDERFADEIVESTFDGAWAVSAEGFTDPPWWFEAVFGNPSSTNVSGSLYDYDYSLTNSNDPRSLRLYMPTEGFGDYEMLGGCVITSVSVDQSNDGPPEISINGAYAQEPQTNSSLSPSVDDFSESSFVNRDAEVKHDGTTVGKAQTATLSIETNTELIMEIGSENAVDFSPKAFNPSITFDKIVDTGQTKDLLSIFRNYSAVTAELVFDNGETGDASYIVDFNVTNAVPDSWTESGRNDPEADLVEEVDMMGEVADATITTSVGGGTVPGL
jgi:hypothetical protein